MPQSNSTGRRLAAVMADHDRGPEFAVVACTRCSSTARIEDTRATSNAELRQAFEDLGWSVLPTLCPEHSGTRDNPPKGQP